MHRNDITKVSNGKKTIKIDEPLVSVVVLCYQNYTLLERCVNNVLTQSYPRIELIIADDASDYFPKEKLETFIEENKKDNLINYSIIVNPVNLGTVKNIKNAFESVNGEYYITSGADDTFADENAIMSFIEGFALYPDAVWMCGNSENVDFYTGKVVDKFPTEYDRPLFFERDARKLWGTWARRGILGSCAICYRKSVLDIVNGFDLNYVYMEDWPIFLKLLRNGYAPGYVDKLVCKRTLGGITFSGNVAGISARKRYIDEKYKLFQKEVAPYYKNMMTKEDIKKYKYYFSEILDRSNFFDVEWPSKNRRIDKLKLVLSSPKKFSWILERKVNMHYERIKKTFFQWNAAFLLIGLLMLYILGTNTHSIVSNIIGYSSLTIAIIQSLFTIVVFYLKKTFNLKDKKRFSVTHS